MSGPEDTTTHSSRFQTAGAVAAAIALSIIYAVLLLTRPTPGWPRALREANLYFVRMVYRLLDAVCGMLGASPPSTELRGAVYLLLTGVLVPWVALVAAGRGRPQDLGCRRPNRIGLRLMVVGYVLALPLQFWMVRSPEFAAYYQPHLERVGFLVFGLYYAVNMFSEHFFFHGVLLAVCRPGHRWPMSPPVARDGGPRAIRVLQWFGLAQRTSGARRGRRVTQWMGLPSGCVPAICTSGVLFAVIHIGKDPRELLLSLPGGVALAYLAYRTNSWLVPFILHVATAGTACAMMVHLG